VTHTKTIDMAIQTKSELNQRGGWWVVNDRKKEQQRHALTYLKVARCPKQKPLKIKFTRYGPRRLDPDAVASSNKHVQDAVCKYLGCDDGDESIKFEYEQMKDKTYRVVVQIEFANLPDEEEEPRYHMGTTA
jgi:hypothetical protein